MTKRRIWMLCAAILLLLGAAGGVWLYTQSAKTQEDSPHKGARFVLAQQGGTSDGAQ